MPVLIVNNDVSFLNTLQHAFEMQGHQVIASKTSVTTKSLFLQYKPRAVVLDVFMQDKDGFEVLKELRAVCKKTPIIAVASSERYLQLIKKLGANMTLLKSTEPSYIVNTIANQQFLMPC
jgi:DNA-binding response OmpR family regulator